ncbi:MAG TPA: nitrogenase-stabilizing/protective protein NifW [Methylococcaceae bacterium]|nr:nitrogenase-stabilizing/protective protein NifW [Methylococcaceae bacterium]
MSLRDDLEELESAEDFLDYFQVPYDPAVVHVNRLHILQRFHNYLADSKELLPEEDGAMRAVYRKLLERAYQDFVESSAIQEKVFKVFRMHEPQTTFVPIEGLFRR